MVVPVAATASTAETMRAICLERGRDTVIEIPLRVGAAMARSVAAARRAHGSWRFLMHRQKKSNHDCFSFPQRSIPVAEVAENSLKHRT
jgi:hypothetical protein